MASDFKKQTSGLFFIRHEIIQVEYAQLKGSHHQSCCIDADASPSLLKQLLNKLILSFFQALDPKRHASQVGDLLFGISQGQMSQESFVVFVNLIVDECLLSHQVFIHAVFESFNDFLEYGLVKHHSFPFHHT